MNNHNATQKLIAQNNVNDRELSSELQTLYGKSLSDVERDIDSELAKGIDGLSKVTDIQKKTYKNKHDEIFNAAQEVLNNNPDLSYTDFKKQVNFKLRKGMPIGVRVTLRDTKMYEFLERLVAVALPRIRDFKGINEKFDGRGNYTLGIAEQIIFPEIDIDKITKIFGMEITFVTTAKTDEEAYALLREFGLPFKNAKKK